MLENGSSVYDEQLNFMLPFSRLTRPEGETWYEKVCWGGGNEIWVVDVRHPMSASSIEYDTP